MNTTLPARALVTLAAVLALVASTAQTAFAATSAAAAHGTARQARTQHSGVAPDGSIPGGRQLWLDQFAGGNKRDAFDATLAASPDGSVVYVTGYTARPEKPRLGNLTTVAYNTSTGAEIWMAAYQGTRFHPNGGTLSITVSPNGNELFIAGGSFYIGSVFAYNAHTGGLLWETDSGARHSRPAYLAVSPDSSLLYVGGNDTRDIIGFHTLAAQSGNTAAPTAMTTFRYRNPANQVAVTPNGSEVILTSQNATVAYDAATGAQLWRVPAGGHEAISPDSSAVIVAKSKVQTSTGLWYYLITAYDPVSGAKLWAARYSTQYGTSRDEPAVALSPDGSTLFITGATNSSKCCKTQVVTVAYNASDGSELWTAGYTGPADSSPTGQALTVAPDGSDVYVLASTTTGDVIIGYAAASGTQLWDAVSSERFSSIAVSANSHTVMGTGTGTGANGLDVYQTVGYRA
jgi:WD40 repeat protein